MMRQEKLFKFPDLKDLPDNLNLGLFSKTSAEHYTPGSWFLDDITENYRRLYLPMNDKDGHSTNKFVEIHCDMVSDDPEVIEQWKNERDEYYDGKIRSNKTMRFWNV
jgi:hypothetical protein